MAIVLSTNQPANSYSKVAEDFKETFEAYINLCDVNCTPHELDRLHLKFQQNSFQRLITKFSNGRCRVSISGGYRTSFVWYGRVKLSFVQFLPAKETVVDNWTV